MKYAIDIDGTLTVETEGWDYENRTPNKEYIAGVNGLFDSGHHILLFSSRFVEDMEVTAAWLKKYNVRYHELILGKPQYDFIIDDKAMLPTVLRAI